ncbi:hypothetical protein [Halostella sp. PRR32]|uniref:hypothetical protein n=1 Tax=Halostella sp. PRR32 TaxID=3098147 RepID=UPI002B1E4213|nr:hypothetical protein [Halostella sp. PRR32]
MSPRADCSDCAWAFEADDHGTVADKLEAHARKEQHHVDFQRIVTDGGREMVYVTARKYDAKRPFHTDPDCHHLEKAVSIRSVPRETLNDSYKECDHCAGEIDKPAGVGEGHLDSLKAAAEDGPDVATDGGVPDPLNFEAAVNDALHAANDPESHVERCGCYFCEQETLVDELGGGSDG